MTYTTDCPDTINGRKVTLGTELTIEDWKGRKKRYRYVGWSLNIERSLVIEVVGPLNGNHELSRSFLAAQVVTVHRTKRARP